LEFPEEIREQYDERVASFWLDGNPVLLQLSSYLRESGNRVSAGDRLSERIARHNERWRTYKLSGFPDAPDKAAAQYTGDDGNVWIHIYLVWHHLAVYATISGPEDMLRKRDNWALETLRTIHLTVQ
jgi:hypothetical protein